MSNGMCLLPASNKIFFTFFLSIIAVAIGIGFLNSYDKTGFSPEKTVRYYCGNEAEEFDPNQTGEEYAASMQEGIFFKKSYRELLNVTHAHIFTIPIVVFILSRILAMTQLCEGFKITIYSVSFAGVITQLAVPWLVRFVSPHLAITFVISNILLVSAFIAFLFFPLYEMWFKGRRRE